MKKSRRSRSSLSDVSGSKDRIQKEFHKNAKSWYVPNKNYDRPTALKEMVDRSEKLFVPGREKLFFPLDVRSFFLGG